jgi:hypothetical protein
MSSTPEQIDNCIIVTGVEFAGNCRRRTAVVGGENVYEICGEDFIYRTTPYENRPENLKVRKATDNMCRRLTALLGGDYD